MPHDLQLRLGAAIKAHRRRIGVTQEELAWRADLHRTYVADIERGSRNLTLRSIGNLARALDISIEHLLSHPAVPDSATRKPPGVGEVLLIEDSATDAELTLRAFKRANFTNPIKVAKTGREALDYLYGRGRFRGRDLVPPQLVLLDLNLPDMRGADLLKEIKGTPETSQVPVVVLTVSRDDKNIIECSRLGADNYIVKPVDFISFGKITPKLNLHWALLNQRGPGMKKPR